MCSYAHFATLEKHQANSVRFVRTDGLKAYFIAPVHQLIWGIQLNSKISAVECLFHDSFPPYTHKWHIKQCHLWHTYIYSWLAAIVTPPFSIDFHCKILLPLALLHELFEGLTMRSNKIHWDWALACDVMMLDKWVWSSFLTQAIKNNWYFSALYSRRRKWNKILVLILLRPWGKFAWQLCQTFSILVVLLLG